MDTPANGRAGYRPDLPGDRPSRPAPPSRSVRGAVRDGRREPGLAGWQALLVLLVIAAIGGAVDVVAGEAVRGGFNIGLIVASVVAILVVRRRNMLTIVVAPPLVYAAASILLLYVRSGGLNNRKVLLDAAVNWLVYGFPAMAAATAAVLVIAAVRLIRGRSRSGRGPASQRPVGQSYSAPGQPYPVPSADDGFSEPQRFRAGGQRP